jgi:hypothetical protein
MVHQAAPNGPGAVSAQTEEGQPLQPESGHRGRRCRDELHPRKSGDQGALELAGVRSHPLARASSLGKSAANSQSASVLNELFFSSRCTEA